MVFISTYLSSLVISVALCTQGLRYISTLLMLRSGLIHMYIMSSTGLNILVFLLPMYTRSKVVSLYNILLLRSVLQ